MAEEIKIRCSALGRIMTFDPETQITETQLKDLESLEETKNATTWSNLTMNQEEELNKISKKKDEGTATEAQIKKLDGLIAKRDKKPELSAKQEETRIKLIKKRDAEPALSKGAKTAVEEIYVEDKFSFRKGLSSKFIQKGHSMEDKAIKVVSDLLGLEDVIKNEQHYDNEYIQGTPDAIKRLGFGSGFQFDIKNLYYPDGLMISKPLDPIYDWQGKGYNWMLGFETGYVVKILQNLPADLLEIEVKKLWKENGRDWFEEIPEKFYEEVRDYFNFEKLPLEDRLKIFRVDVTEADKEAIKDAVKLARIHYGTLDEIWKNRNVEHLAHLKSLT